MHPDKLKILSSFAEQSLKSGTRFDVFAAAKAAGLQPPDVMSFLFLHPKIEYKNPGPLFPELPERPVNNTWGRLSPKSRHLKAKIMGATGGKEKRSQERIDLFKKKIQLDAQIKSASGDEKAKLERELKNIKKKLDNL